MDTTMVSELDSSSEFSKSNRGLILIIIVVIVVVIILQL